MQIKYLLTPLFKLPKMTKEMDLYQERTEIVTEMYMGTDSQNVVIGRVNTCPDSN